MQTMDRAGGGGETVGQPGEHPTHPATAEKAATYPPASAAAATKTQTRSRGARAGNICFASVSCCIFAGGAPVEANEGVASASV